MAVRRDGGENSCIWRVQQCAGSVERVRLSTQRFGGMNRNAQLDIPSREIKGIRLGCDPNWTWMQVILMNKSAMNRTAYYRHFAVAMRGVRVRASAVRVAATHVDGPGPRADV